ncbi:DKNYY domain-containing protein [Morganella sp. B601]|uniref:DKNYY domain-containing protein n=1 Tax=Morganella sp. B601 TaxID=3444315 RepID=UPI003EBC6342
MSEPQFLFSEIPLSRAAFDRWLISVVPDTETWPVTAPPVQETIVGDALLSYFIAAGDTQRCLLLHDKSSGTLRCALWLINQELRPVMMQLTALLATTAPFIATGKTGSAQLGENICGTLHLSKNTALWADDCPDFSFPDWALTWIDGLGDVEEDSDKPWIDSKLYNRMKRRYNHYLRNATPENRIPLKKTELYLSDGTYVVNFQGKRVQGANPLTFRCIANDGMTSIYTDGKGIWIDCFYTREERRQLATQLEEGDFEVWQEDYDTPFLLRIRDKAWFLGHNGPGRGFELQFLPVDGISFRQITWGAFADKDYFYMLDSGNGGLAVVPGIDTKTVRPFDDLFFFAGNQVYSRGKLLPEADAGSFRTLGAGYYADNRHVWHFTTPKPGIDPATFEWLDEYNGLAKDASHVFMNEIDFPEADVQTVTLVTGGLFLLWRDKNHIWYKDQMLEGADVSHNTPYPWRGTMYCQIGDQIWFAQERLNGADPESFFVTGWEEAEDKYGAWYRTTRL